jgi:hypothetical protein
MAGHLNLVIALPTEVEKKEVRANYLAGGPGEIDGKHGFLTAQIMNIKDQFLWQDRSFTPHHRFHAQGRQPKCVAGY